jgi:hypothetical protein
MTFEDEFIGELQGYLDEFDGITPLSAEVRDAVRAQLPTTKQIARRFPAVTNRVALAGAGTAIVLITVVSISLLSKGDLGPFAASPSPTKYVVGPSTVASLGAHQLTFMVPEGWTDVGGRGVRKDDLSLTIWVSPRGIWVNPCFWSVGDDLGRFADPPFYRSIFMLEAFWDWWGRPEPVGFGDWAGEAQATLPRGTEPTTTEVDGWDARYAEFRVPDDLDLTSCDGGEYRIWIGLDEQIKTISAPGELNRLWLLKVDLPAVREGGMVIIDASSFPTSSRQDLAELQAIVDSIQVESP